MTRDNSRRPAVRESRWTRGNHDTPADPYAVPPGPWCPEYIVPYQRVALRVIFQAFRDLESPAEASAAFEFLDGSPMLRHWSAVAALDAASIRASARHLVARLAEATATGRARVPRDHRRR